jgi:hypothetical protein
LKLPEETLGEALQDIGTENSFLNGTPVAQEIKSRTDIWDYIEFKSFAQQRKQLPG